MVKTTPNMKGMLQRYQYRLKTQGAETSCFEKKWMVMDPLMPWATRMVEELHYLRSIKS